MSEYKKQIAAGALTAVVIVLILAGGASYLFPLQPTQTTSTALNTRLPSTSTAAVIFSTTMATGTANYKRLCASDNNHIHDLYYYRRHYDNDIFTSDHDSTH